MPDALLPQVHLYGAGVPAELLGEPSRVLLGLLAIAVRGEVDDEDRRLSRPVLGHERGRVGLSDPAHLGRGVPGPGATIDGGGVVPSGVRGVAAGRAGAAAARGAAVGLEGGATVGATVGISVATGAAVGTDAAGGVETVGASMDGVEGSAGVGAGAATLRAGRAPPEKRWKAK